jgi:hypothetical protein
MARSERASDANDQVRLANASARLLATLSKKKRLKPGRPPLRERMAAEAEPVG